METNQVKRVLSAAMLKRPEIEAHFIKHEWQELVEKLSSSEDPKLRFIGFQESEIIRAKEKVAKVS